MPSQLSQREREVLDLLSRSYDDRRIACELLLSDKTVRKHASDIVDKLDASDRSGAIIQARCAGLGD